MQPKRSMRAHLSLRALGAIAIASMLCSCAPIARPGEPRSTIISRSEVDACPLGVPETRVSITDAADGAHVFFVTTPEHVEELRRRVREHVRAASLPRGHSEGHDGDHQIGNRHGLRLWALGPTTKQVEDVPGGTRLVVAAVDPARDDDVRVQLRARVAQLDSRSCSD